MTDFPSPREAALRAAIVGGGLMGRWHAHAVEKCGGCVAAVVDTSEAAARRLAARHRAASTFTRVEPMLEQIRPDVVHICTPLATHQPLAELALEASCHLLVEKPLTADARSTEFLLERAAQRGVLLCPLHQFAFQDGVLQTLRWLPDLGRVIHLQATFCSAGGAGLEAAVLDTIVADILPHPLSLLQTLAPHGLASDGWTATRPADGEMRAHCTTQGVTASLVISMNARPTESSFLILGTEGAIHLNLFHGYAFRQTGQVSRMRKIIHPFDSSLRHLAAAAFNLGGRTARSEPAYPGLRRLVCEFYHAVGTKSAAPISPEATLQAAHVREVLMQQAGLLQKPAVGDS
ncbi:MAG TPA: Gfo/Idh/MocA family oxidoreductase [Abditibacteriaceae bacterium]|nr:Gfo/Idh/MocA family oxidoreductase [Abditibacteriaceae bacterium]